jgi:hypothetical protein
MDERIMSRPLAKGADENWNNTFGRKERPEYVPVEVLQEKKEREQKKE